MNLRNRCPRYEGSVPSVRRGFKVCVKRLKHKNGCDQLRIQFRRFIASERKGLVKKWIEGFMHQGIIQSILADESIIVEDKPQEANSGPTRMLARYSRLKKPMDPDRWPDKKRSDVD